MKHATVPHGWPSFFVKNIFFILPCLHWSCFIMDIGCFYVVVKGFMTWGARHFSLVHFGFRSFSERLEWCPERRYRPKVHVELHCVFFIVYFFLWRTPKISHNLFSTGFSARHKCGYCDSAVVGPQSGNWASKERVVLDNQEHLLNTNKINHFIDVFDLPKLWELNTIIWFDYCMLSKLSQSAQSQKSQVTFFEED